jgi:NAD-dependent DNA ligase
MAKKTENTNLLEVMEVLEERSSKLQGKSFCITGHLGLPRKKIVEMVRMNGGIVHDNVGWGTNFLICNYDWNKGTTITEKKSSKLIKAEDCGVKVITESEFVKMLS